MKKIYSLLLSATIISTSLPAAAQQLTNNDFEGSWSTCTPWTNGNGNKTVGQNPANWCISHVMGITTGTLAGTGKKAMGEKTDGYNSTSAVKVYNDETGALGITRVVPGYLTTGTSWSTAKGSTSSSHDGGTWGGVSFSYRPDAIQFMYKREYASASATTEPCSFVAYLWKGSASQESVPVTITSGTKAPTTATMANRDRNILFKNQSTTTGGAITYSSDFALIGRINVTEAGTVAAWTAKTLEFEYLTNDTPTMLNVIFAANDYFNTAAATKGNSLYIDDVKLLYYSRLATLNVNGTAVAGFSPETYTYTIDSEMPAADAFTYTTVGTSGSANVSVSLDTDNAVATITVTNAGEDVDGATSHTYTLQFNKKAEEPNPTPVGDTQKFPGSLKITITPGEGADPSELASSGTVEITPTSDGLYSFVLPNLSLDLVGDGTLTELGDIVVYGVNRTQEADGSYTYSGSVKNFSLAEGEIIANVAISGTQTGNDVVMNIAVDWLDGIDGAVIAPITVVFTTLKNYEGVKYDGNVNITLGEANFDSNGTVYINTVSPGICTLLLPDFSLDLDGTGEPTVIGDIFVENVNVSGEGEKTYSLTTPTRVTLADGEILADVTLEGTESGDILKMLIHVKWVDADGNEIAPIEVTFNGERDKAGISDIVIDNTNAPVYYYNLQGIRVSENNLTPGTYIRRQGTDVKKVYIR